MSQMGYVFLGWTVTGILLAAYSLRTVLRGRKLSRSLPPQERTWR
jgi:hypothetical protein